MLRYQGGSGIKDPEGYSVANTLLVSGSRSLDQTFPKRQGEKVRPVALLLKLRTPYLLETPPHSQQVEN